MNFWDILLIIIKFAGAVVVFIYGMKLMSEGLQKVAGSKMRSIMGHMTNSPFRGIVTGAAVTAAIQSSTATTVMVVSFVNSGLLTLAGAIAVVMGANIGTTITSWIILLGMGGGGAKFVFPLVVFAVASPFMLMKGDKVKSISEFIIGFGILMVGLQFLQDAMPDLSQNPAILEAMRSWSDWGFWSILIFIIIGAVLTVLIQASSAVMAITLIMTANGWIGFDIAVAIIMGQNIGTTLTANIAAMVANAAGKKAARAHFVFNMVGTILTLLVLYPELNLIAFLAEKFSGEAAAFDYRLLPAALVPLAITIFHTFFNVINTFILAFFIPQFIKVVNWMVKTSSEENEDEYRLRFISGGFTNTPELNIQAAQKEIETFSTRVLRMFTFLPALRTAKDDEEFEKIVARIEKYEGITDRMEMEIAKFLTKTAAADLSEEGSRRVSSMLRIVDNLESIGDTIFQIAMTRKNKREEAVHFDQGLNDNLQHMTELVQKALDVMDQNLRGDYHHIDLNAAYAAESDINHYRDTLRSRHLDALKLGVYDFSIGNAYSGLYALYEKLGDYVINISEAMDNSVKAAETLGEENV
ncbi:MAG: Na/Pi cotransporter family protein [Bacteroidales bacterium]|nr:Na/Pi cotransporter family protein [Bacteroidales bacterium]